MCIAVEVRDRPGEVGKGHITKGFAFSRLILGSLEGF